VFYWFTNLYLVEDPKIYNVDLFLDIFNFVFGECVFDSRIQLHCQNQIKFLLQLTLKKTTQKFGPPQTILHTNRSSTLHHFYWVSLNNFLDYVFVDQSLIWYLHLTLSVIHLSNSHLYFHSNVVQILMGETQIQSTLNHNWFHE